MLISKKHKKIIINSRHPERITMVIPTAKTFDYKGQTLVAVPHELDAVRVLRNIGYDAPSPIAHYYEWAGRYGPFAHQQTTAEFLTLNARAFVLNQIGTGKTLSVLWALDYLRNAGQCRKIVIVSPLSTLERVWADELFKHFPHLDFTVLHGTADKRRKLLALDVDVYIINHDGVKVLQKELAAREDIDAVIVDELAEFRNASTDRWKSLHAVCKDRKWVWGMTGSPTPKGPTDAWSQCRLISPDRVPKYYSRFRDLVMRQVTTFKWSARPESARIVKEAMQPAILFTRDECLDLPPCTFSTRHVEMGDEQKSAYKDMMNKLKIEFNGGEVTAVNEAVKAMKLVQIACGVAYGQDGEHIIFPAEERIKAVKEIVEQAEGKVIVYVPLTGGLQRIAAELADAGYKTAIVHGETPKRERDTIFSAFQDEHNPLRILIAHPQCMSHGLTLTSASVIIWYIPTNNFAVYEQACGRIVRQGQTRSQHIIHLEGSPVEQRLYTRLEQRGTSQGILLDLIKQEQEV
jgi:SNF2 family DNA or RNA helicase